MGRKPQLTKDGGSEGTGSLTGTEDWLELGRKGRKAVNEGAEHSSSQGAGVGVGAEGSVGVGHRGQGKGLGERYLGGWEEKPPNPGQGMVPGSEDPGLGFGALPEMPEGSKGL